MPNLLIHTEYFLVEKFCECATVWYKENAKPHKENSYVVSAKIFLVFVVLIKTYPQF